MSVKSNSSAIRASPISAPQVTASTMRSSSSTDAYSHRVVYMRASANTTTFTAESIMSEKAKPVPLSTSPSSRVPQAAAITAAQVAMQSSTASGMAFTSLRAFPVPLVIRLAPCGRVWVVGWAAGALRGVWAGCSVRLVGWVAIRVPSGRLLVSGPPQGPHVLCCLDTPFSLQALPTRAKGPRSGHLQCAARWKSPTALSSVGLRGCCWFVAAGCVLLSTPLRVRIANLQFGGVFSQTQRGGVAFRLVSFVS